MRKKFGTFVQTIPVPKSVKIPGFLCFMWKNTRKQNILNIRRLFGHFWENSAKILPHICTAAYIFTYVLSYVAEESASWEHATPKS
jgi:hypothetical protein